MERDNMKTGMTNHPMPQWSDEQVEAGNQNRQAWEGFFPAVETPKAEENPFNLKGENIVKAAEIRVRHEAELLRYPNVVAVGEGIQTKRGKPTGRMSVVVFVDHKIPPGELREDEILPEELEGIPVDVVEASGIVVF